MSRKPPPPDLRRRGLMLVASSPSGAGKTTLSRKLLETDDRIILSISVTTRPRRRSEVDGIDYRFISVKQFERMRDRDELLEWAQVHGNFYGTPAEPVEKALSEGNDVLFDIDWQGAQQLYGKAAEDVVSVFILPPSALELRTRLERRAEDSAEVIMRRLTNASEEVAHWQEYDYVIVNQDLGESLNTLHAILDAERARRTRWLDLDEFVRNLRDDLQSG